MKVMLGALLALGPACAGDSEGYGASLDAGGGTPQCFSSNDCATGWTCSQFGTCEPPSAGDADAGVTPPQEVEREFGDPVHTLRYVYVNMPDLDALAKIDGATLAISAVPVGDQPDVVATIPGTDDALVLDRGSATVTIVRPTVDRDQRTTLRTLEHLNVLTVEPGGRWAVAWFDLQKAIFDAGGIGTVDALGSFQDVTLVSLERGAEQTIDLSVGFRPREVEFDASGTHAYVITDDGVSIIDLDAAAAGDAHVRATVPVVPDPLIDPGSLEVEITSGGGQAVARALGEPVLYVTSLADGRVDTIALASEPTDLDLLPDGHRVLAVLREAREVVLLDVPGGVLERIDLGGLPLGAPVGSAAVDDAGGRAVLYTNAADLERVVVLDLAGATHAARVWPLEKGVRAVAFAPSGDKVLILHSKLPGDPLATTELDELIDRSYGYTVLDLASGFPKLTITEVDPGAFTFAPDSLHAYLALDGGDAEGAITAVQVIDLSTFIVRTIELGSPPEALGVLPSAGMVFVSQRHPLGRVTFLDLATAASRTVTGFELNSHIID